MLTGLQVRKARTVLGWGRTKFSRNVHLTEDLVTAIESSDGPAWLTDEQEASIRRALELAGVEIVADGPRFREDQS
ncbi:hypothetical protein [Lichenibacterium ramalinae]|uniref:Transcriptional regulator n=1 Tax=Lichenibacterium ramalinae TaxID=2316527 RepID=A0A4Q2RHM9_9HYPH|nr:hypothetical protein [Lichenibacterium ramalinae]RYB06244.1 hypothetical protein D3272_05615 [Lichenibacterium ramalinae]